MRVSLLPAVTALLAAWLGGCADEPAPAKATLEQLMDPTTCRSCHEQTYAEWAQSMHAYAAKDPVFIAQNRKAQAETNGELGDFCIRCHAPLATQTGMSQDGLNLDELPDALSGVTCYVCHSVAEVSGTHNNALVLAEDGVLRGGVRRPVANSFHDSAYSPLLDGTSPEASALCGACHDLVTPEAPLGHGLELERTFAEWSESLFAPAQAERADSALGCSACHMPVVERAPVAPGAPPRPRHQHLSAAVDVALTAFPATGDPAIDEASANERAVQELLDGTLRVDVCVQRLPGPGFAVEVTLDNVNAGHSFPSGSTHNRDLWIELIAFDAEGSVLYESGARYGEAASDADADLWSLKDRLLDEDGQPTHALWRAASIERRALPAAVTSDLTDPRFYRNHQLRRFPLAPDAAISGEPARVTVRARLRPVPLAALDELIAEGYLAASVKKRVPTFDLLPNRHLAADANLGQLAEVTFEWSEVARSSGRVDAWRDATTPFVKDCLGMPSKRGPR